MKNWLTKEAQREIYQAVISYSGHRATPDEIRQRLKDANSVAQMAILADIRFHHHHGGGSVGGKRYS